MKSIRDDIQRNYVPPSLSIEEKISIQINIQLCAKIWNGIYNNIGTNIGEQIYNAKHKQINAKHLEQHWR